jgi:hypothetical protein
MKWDVGGSGTRLFRDLRNVRTSLNKSSVGADSKGIELINNQEDKEC